MYDRTGHGNSSSSAAVVPLRNFRPVLLQEHSQFSLTHISLGQQRRVSRWHGLSGTTTRNVPQSRASATMFGGAVGLRNVARRGLIEV